MRSFGFFVMWLLGSVVAVSVAFAGVAVVDDELINPPPAQVSNLTQPRSNQLPGAVLEPDSPAALPTSNAGNALVAQEQTPPAASLTPNPQPTIATASPTTTREPTLESPPRLPAPPTATQTTVSGAATTPAPTTPPPPTPVPPTPAAPTLVPPTPVPPTPVPPTLVAPTPTAIPPTPARAAQVVTYNLVGGTTAISFSPTEVRVLWATPKPGFSVDIDGDADEVRVEFESDDHRSRIDARWASGPAQEISEDD